MKCIYAEPIYVGERVHDVSDKVIIDSIAASKCMDLCVPLCKYSFPFVYGCECRLIASHMTICSVGKWQHEVSALITIGKYVRTFDCATIILTCR